MLPSPTELKYFLEVSDTLNVSRAAERLGVSQPTLSLAIRRLEEAFVGVLPGRVAARLKGIRPVKGAPKYIDHHPSSTPNS